MTSVRAAAWPGPDLTEFDWWLEAGHPGLRHSHPHAGCHGLHLSQRWRADRGQQHGRNLQESLRLDVFLNPKLSIYYDVDKIKGAYIEAGCFTRHSLLRRAAAHHRCAGRLQRRTGSQRQRRERAGQL